MSVDPRLGEVLEGYAETAQELLADWTPYLTGLSAKASSSAYDQEDAADDFPIVAKLVAESAFKVVGQASRTVNILTLGFTEKTTSGAYVIPAQATGVELALSLKGDLRSVTGEVLPMKQVTIVPDKLVPPADFDLEVETAGVKGRTYDGWVLAKDPTGKVVAEFPVSRTVG